jgi:hypothetical protein
MRLSKSKTSTCSHGAAEDDFSDFFAAGKNLAAPASNFFLSGRTGKVKFLEWKWKEG